MKRCIFGHALSPDEVIDIAAIVFDFVDEPKVETAAGLFHNIGVATIYNETTWSCVVSPKNPRGIPQGRVIVPLAKPVPAAYFKAHVVRVIRGIFDSTGLRVVETDQLDWDVPMRPTESASPRKVEFTPGYALDFEAMVKRTGGDN